MSISDQDLAEILRIIEDEPELPGKMEDELWQTFSGFDRDGLTQALRVLVRTTKDCISERITDRFGR